MLNTLDETEYPLFVTVPSYKNEIAPPSFVEIRFVNEDDETLTALEATLALT